MSEESNEVVRLRHRNALLENLISSIDSGIRVVTSEGERVLQNAQYEKLLRVPQRLAEWPDEELLGEHILGQLSEPERLLGLLEEIEGDPDIEREATAELIDGSSLFFSTGPLRDSEGNTRGRYCVLRDATEQSRREREARYLAHHDKLTGLPNRERVRHAMDQMTGCRPSGPSPFALLLIDLNRFRAINENYGQSFGDALLRDLACVITKQLPKGATLARYGTDQFMLLLPAYGREETSVLAEALHGVLNSSFTVTGRSVQISAAIAGACCPEDGTTSEQLLNCVDLAIKRAKTPDTRQFCFYTPELGSSARRRALIEQRLRDCDDDCFTLLYQPKVRAESGKVTGGEALLRWRDEDLGQVAPSEFIPIAEETGTIVRIGDWVLRRALTQLAEWQREGIALVPVSVNISARQFRQQDVVCSVESALRASGVSPSLLELELTESLFADDPEYAIRILNELGDRGVRLSLDDFGTGFSNLSYLQRIRFDTLKIDGSFVRDLEGNPKSRQIVHTTAELAHGLGMRALAEQVEDAAQARLVHELQVDEVQGYFFSPPVPAESFGEMMRAGLLVA